MVHQCDQVFKVKKNPQVFHLLSYPTLLSRKIAYSEHALIPLHELHLLLQVHFHNKIPLIKVN